MPAAVETLARNVNRLLDALPERYARPEMARRMGIGDKTLGFLKSGTGNPTLETIEAAASYLKVKPWELIRPESDASQAMGQDEVTMAQAVELLVLMGDARPEDKNLRRITWDMIKIAAKGIDKAAGDQRKAVSYILEELAKEP